MASEGRRVPLRNLGPFVTDAFDRVTGEHPHIEGNELALVPYAALWLTNAGE
ncbi:MAG: hypothetical protein NTZ03_03125 [Actinobacteria bacterium]|nr:hypothetical protein [Actinomycetota bacterium]